MTFILIAIIIFLIVLLIEAFLLTDKLDTEIIELKAQIKEPIGVKELNDLKDKLTIAWFDTDELKEKAKKDYQKLYYARKRIIALELEIVELTGNKRRLSGNSFKD